MLLIAKRTFIMYCVVLLAVRIMGKSELSRMSPFQTVISFMIAELATIAIDSPSAPITDSITAVFTLVLLQISISLLSIKSEKFKNFISGRPSLLIKDGKLNLKELRRQRITNTDLLEQLRIAGCPSISDIRHAILETSGQLTIISKSSEHPVTRGDIRLKVRESALPVIIISDGTIYHKSLTGSGLSESVLNKRLAAAGITDISDIFLAFSDENKKIHVYLKSESSDPYAVEIIL